MISKKHPSSLHWFSTVHFCERFSYYGIKSLLLLYLITKLDFSDERAYAVFGVYATLTYVTPLLGGYVADKLIGFYASIWLGLLFIIAGHASIFLISSELGLFFGLGLVATGSGFYKSNINVLIGNLYEKESSLKDSAYTIFYVYQNAGSFLAPLICGYVGLEIGWSYGFSLAAIGGVLGLVVLSIAQKFKRQVYSVHSVRLGLQIKKIIAIVFVALCLSSALGVIVFYGEESLDMLAILSLLYFGVFYKHYLSLPKNERGNMLLVLFGVLAVALSGALISHGAGVFTLFMDRNVDSFLLSYEVPVTFVQSIDPLTVFLVGPIMAVLLKRYMKVNRSISAMGKTLVGFAIIIVAYGYLYGLCEFTNQYHHVHLVPFMIGLVVLAASDILIYPNVLTFCSRRTPKHLMGMVMGFVVFGMALSQVFGVYFAKMASIPRGYQKISVSESLAIYQSFFGKMVLISLFTFVVLYLGKVLINKRKEKYGPQ